jgi:hypothetical protein
MDTLVIDRRIAWNSSKLKEIDEAKKIIMDFKRAGYEILLANGMPMERFRPSFEEVVVKTKRVACHILKILTDKGDERVTWNKENGREAKEAKNKFEELLKKGYKAYSVDSLGKKKRKIEEFDVEAEEILMVSSLSRG